MTNGTQSILDNNISVLLERRKGDVFFVEKGELKKMRLCQKVHMSVSKFFCESYQWSCFQENQRSVREVIQKIVQQENLNEKLKGSELKEFFFEKLAPLSERAFDRTDISKTSLDILEKSIAKETDNSKKPDTKDLDEKQQEDEKKLTDAIVKAKLALKLGIKPIETDGCSEGYKIRAIITEKDDSGKEIQVIERVGVFKTEKGDSLSLKQPSRWTRWRNRICYAFGYRKDYFTYMANKSYLAEELAYIIDREIGTNIVPPTKVVSLPLDSRESIRGSFQIFIPNAKSLREVWGVRKNFKLPFFNNHEVAHKIEELSDSEKEQYEKIKVFRAIIGDLDPHAENILIVKEDEDEDPSADNKAESKNDGKTAKYYSIDHGMAFPIGNDHPSSFLTSIDAYGNCELDNKHFSDQTISLIEKIFTEIVSLFSQLRKCYSKGEEREAQEITNKRINALCERICSLYNTSKTRQPIKVIEKAFQPRSKKRRRSSSFLREPNNKKSLKITEKGIRNPFRRRETEKKGNLNLKLKRPIGTFKNYIPPYAQLLGGAEITYLD